MGYLILIVLALLVIQFGSMRLEKFYIRVGIFPWLFRLMPNKPLAITLYPFILFRDKSAQKLLMDHEMRHIRQIRKKGVVVFYVKYLYFNIRYGYENNPLEIEARKHSGRGEK